MLSCFDCLNDDQCVLDVPCILGVGLCVLTVIMVINVSWMFLVFLVYNLILF